MKKCLPFSPLSCTIDWYVMSTVSFVVYHVKGVPMKGIKEHIKTGQYKTVYLLYGSEMYLRRLYTSKLKAGALGGGDEMNLSVFSGKDTDWNEVRNLAETCRSLRTTA